LIDAATRDQLVDELLQILPGRTHQRRRRNIEHLERVGNVQSDVTRQRATHLVDSDLQQNLRARSPQAFQESRCRVQNALWRANSYRIRTRLLRHETDIEQTPQSIYHFIEVLWRCRSTDVKRSRNHAIELPVVFRPIRRNEQLL